MEGKPKSRSKNHKPIIPAGNFARALANATPDKKRNLLGEALYPLVENLEPSAAPKITGMLLEFNQHQVLWLLESPSALKFMVAVAMEVLKTTPPKPSEAVGGMAKGGSLTSRKPISMETLGLVLANMAPEKVKPLLGELLYPLVEKLEPNAAPKVTGMLMELNHTHIWYFLLFPKALKSAVAKAMEVLRNFALQKQKQPQQHPVADEFGFIEFNNDSSI